MRIRLIAALMALVMMVTLFAGCYTYEEVIDNPTQSATSSKVESSNKTDTSSKKTTSKKKTSSKKKATSSKKTTSKKATYSYPELMGSALYPSGWVSNYSIMAEPSDESIIIDGGDDGWPEDDGELVYGEYTGFGAFGEEIITSLSKILWNGDTIYDVISGEKAFGSPATLWPYGGYMEACGAAYEYDPTNTLYKEQYQKTLKNVMVYEATQVNERWGAPAGTYLALTCWPHGPSAEVYYDDDVWIAKEFLHAHELGITSDGTTDVNYLTQCTRMMKYICETGWEDTWKGGGLLWMDPKYTTSGSAAPQKNSCINAPAADCAVDLYMVTGDTAFLDHARKIYAWVKSQLMDPGDHLMMDKFVYSEGKITTDSGKLAYNTGCMVSAAAGLYEAEKALGAADAQDYMDDSIAFVEAGIKAFMPRSRAINNAMLKHWAYDWNGTPWFNSYMAEGIMDLYHIAENDPDQADVAVYATYFRDAMGYACSNRFYTDQGWFPADLGSVNNPGEKDITVMYQSSIARMLFMAGLIFDEEVA